MKNCNVEILFTDKETGEALLVLNLEDLNHIQENVMKAKIGLEEGEKAKDKIADNGNGHIHLSIGTNSVSLMIFTHCEEFPYTKYATVGDICNDILLTVYYHIHNEPNLICEDDNDCIHRLHASCSNYVKKWFRLNSTEIDFIIKQRTPNMRRVRIWKASDYEPYA